VDFHGFPPLEVGSPPVSSNMKTGNSPVLKREFMGISSK
jgi:hypothetical protein